MKLSEILKGISYTCDSFVDVEISDIAYDSRKAGEGIIFVCLSGAFTDGHRFAQGAYERGSRVFLCEKKVDLPGDAIVIYVSDTRADLARMSCSFFGNPSREIDVIGITGTKGKTTTAHIVKSVLDSAGLMCGIIGTVGAEYGDVTLPTVNTTPESYELQKLLRLMADAGCKAAAIEVSSLGLKFHRTDGIEFSMGVFTNLYPDHIGTNEHESFEEYAFWKTQLFPKCKKTIVNIDDSFSKEVIESSVGEIITYGCDEKADYALLSSEKIKEGSILGMKFSLASGAVKREFKLALPGEINCHNALVAVAVADSLGIEEEKIRSGLMSVYVKGRCEILRESGDITVIIDYAHNGVSLKSIIETARSYEHNRIITLFGSVGGRTECRREELGRVAGSMSDLSVITSDDPDFEDPEKICNEIAGFCKQESGECVIIPDRAKAISFAVKNSEPGDILILAGKGHEQFMKINGQKLPFSEKQEVFRALKEKKEGQ